MIICIAPNCSINCSDWIIFGLGVIVSIGWALFIYLRFKIYGYTRISIAALDKTPSRAVAVVELAVRTYTSFTLDDEDETTELPDV